MSKTQTEYRKAHIQETYVHIDGQTGELLSTTEFKKTNVGAEPEYIKLYLKDLLYIAQLPQGLNSTLYSLLKRMNYEGQIILNSSIKKIICTELKKSMASLDKALSGFVLEKILIRKDKGIYLANPHLFGRGQWSDIAKIRLTIEWNPKGRIVEMPEITTKPNAIPNDSDSTGEEGNE